VPKWQEHTINRSEEGFLKHNSIPQTLGIRPAPGLITDRLFWLAIMAGLIVSVLLSANNLTQLPQGMSLSGLLSLLLWYPLIEELAFRGVVQGTLANHFAGRRTRLGISVANLIATFAFVLWHLLYQAIPIIIVLALPSLVYGFFRDRYQSLLPALLLHGFYNGCFFAAHWFFS
jgi:membrane protease YdiL (CAAX protease family)